MKRLIFPALLLLAACGTPQEQCINRNTRDLRVVERLIVETEGNLQRGYALVTVTEYEDYWGTCYETTTVDGQPVVQPRLCLKERSYTVERPKAIDLNEEARKLDSLKTKRRELARQAEAVIKECKAQYPE
ncbi:hypothetical protein [Tabrizicola sp.]|uniref:hypothetical protein n=1 Tax=Tabrizicola sp. TaxID=2005166 RepID=UPI003F3BDFF1